jgi:hypothetical protein
MDGFGFRPVEPDGIDGTFDLQEREGQHRGRPMRQREEPGTGFTGGLVLGPEAEETGNEDAKGISVRLARHDADDRLFPLPNLALHYLKRSSDLILAHGQERIRMPWKDAINRTGEPVEGLLLRLTLGQPLLTPPLRLSLLGFLPDTRLFIKSPTLQFAEESFPRELLLGNLEGFLDVIIEDFDFHSSRLCTFPGDACTGFFLVPA